MFKTVKSKIIAITIGLFAIFSIVIFGIEILSYYNFKMLKKETCDNQVERFASDLNSSVRQLQENALSLGLSGASFFYYNKHDKRFIDFIVRDNFRNNNKLSIGGGIWFEPYVINSKQKHYSSYAFSKGKNILIDRSYETAKYDYQNQEWYKLVKNSYNLNSKTALIWTAPYRDNTATKELMITVGTAIYDWNGKFVGMSTVDWSLESIVKKLDKLRPTKHSLVLFADKTNDYIVAMCDNNPETDIMTGKSLKLLPWYNDKRANEQEFKYNNKKYIYFTKTLDNKMVLVVAVPNNELFVVQKMRLLAGFILRIISCIVLAYITYIVLTKNINKPINILTASAEEIGAGNLDKKIDIDKPLEFAKLAQTFNKMTTDIKDYLENIHKMTFEREKIDSELNIAREIQESVLPKNFPPYPERTDFDIFASMTPAKEVGGDFYDFYFIGEDTFVITIADVSGHGVPAAMFMMTAKTLLKNLAHRKMTIDEIFNYANEKLCENNDQGFFMTAFFAIINLKTGNIQYVNAGHNPPLIFQNNKFEFMQMDSNIALGVWEDATYKYGELKLNPSESILLYTDGVTEANDESKNLFGETRLIETLNKKELLKSKDVINQVSKSIAEYTKECEQADDITMLAFKYTGVNNMLEKVAVPAQISELKPFINWLENMCMKCGMDEEKKSKLLICAEEIFVNIAYYAYPDHLKDKIQDTTIMFKYVESTREVSIIFTDSGLKYNPLTQSKTPDINSSLEERTPGGLGILMVKNMMTSVDYCYKRKQNILTLTLDI
ncbi:SpoIIE family protein phosphatase [bacterium]|nr:SpoIIE family protein phosphatase [bacterium]